jgi:hypothetical protein
MHRLLLVLLVLPLVRLGMPALQVPSVETGSWQHSALDDWLGGVFLNVSVEANALQLSAGQSSGEYISVPLQAPLEINALVVEWVANVAFDESLRIEIRASTDGYNWQAWREVQPQVQAARNISRLLVVEPTTGWVQYRVRLAATDLVPSLEEIRLIYLNSMSGPSLTDLEAPTPLAGPAALIPPPTAFPRTAWLGVHVLAGTAYQHPQQVVLEQLDLPIDDPTPIATLRALRWVTQNILGQADLPYHYVIDGQGHIYEAYGRVTTQLPGAEYGTVRVAVAADSSGLDGAPREQLVHLLNWLVESYDISFEQVFETSTTMPGRAKLSPDLQQLVDQQIIRSRQYFAYGDASAITDRMSLFNPTNHEARTIITAMGEQEDLSHTFSVPPGQRVDVLMPALFPDRLSPSLTVQSNQPVYTERSLVTDEELIGSTGARDPARTWYFSSGSTVSDSHTTLVVLNLQSQAVSAMLVFYSGETDPVTQTVTFAPQQRTEISLNDLLPDAEFALKLVATQPVVVEQAMSLASGAAYLSPGVSELHRRWLFAEGAAFGDITTTLYLFNPWPQRLAVSLRIMSEDGTSLSRRYAMPPLGQRELPLSELVPELSFAIEIVAERPIAAERVMLFNNGMSGSALPGAPEPATQWTFVDGTTVAPSEQFLLVGNPQSTAVTVEVKYMLGDAQVEQREYMVPPTARLTIPSHVDIPEQSVVTTIVTASQPIVAERTLVISTGSRQGIETSWGVAGR